MSSLDLNPLETAVKNSGSNNGEVITFEVDGVPVSLVRSLKILDTAFLVWPTQHNTTRAQLVFKGDDRKFPVVCTCCLPLDTEMFGRRSKLIQENSPLRLNGAGEKFRDAVEKKCLEIGAERLVVRHADLWRTQHIQMIEAERFSEVIVHYYGPRGLEKSAGSPFDFIDVAKSKGLKPLALKTTYR